MRTQAGGRHSMLKDVLPSPISGRCLQDLQEQAVVGLRMRCTMALQMVKKWCANLICRPAATTHPPPTRHGASSRITGSP